jgi:septum formation protein
LPQTNDINYEKHTIKVSFLKCGGNGIFQFAAKFNILLKQFKKEIQIMPTSSFGSASFSSLVLASKSPRRQHLIKLLGLPFEVLTADTDESFDASHSPADIVKFLSAKKAAAIRDAFPAETQGKLILGADTIVVINGHILNKPTDEADAFRMLRLLSGHTHSVFTGITLLSALKVVSDFEESRVTFSPLSDDEIRSYIAGDTAMDKAGSYGIQDDKAACFIPRIEGCYYNVVGLPLAKVYQMLKAF